MLVAGDGHQVGPVGGLHDHAGDVRARHVEGGGAVAMGTLDAGAGVRRDAPAVAVHALLHTHTHGHDQELELHRVTWVVPYI